MKRLLIADKREALLVTMETILKHWGYRVTATSRQEQLLAFLNQSEADLLLLGASFLAKAEPALLNAVAAKTAEGSCPLIVLTEDGTAEPQKIPHETLAIPLDIFTLFSVVQSHLKDVPRRNLRLTLRLPGMLCRGESCHLTEVLSLSTKGMFIKTVFPMKEGDRLTVTLPLLGMKREMEIEGRVLYAVLPGPENNYLQGVGFEFLNLDAEAENTLETFLEKHFLGELAARQRGSQVPLEEQVRSRRPEVTLHLLSGEADTEEDDGD